MDLSHFVTQNNALNSTCPYMLSAKVWHGIETILNAFMEISPRKTQPISTHRHVCYWYEAFLGRFCCSSLFRV